MVSSHFPSSPLTCSSTTTCFGELGLEPRFGALSVELGDHSLRWTLKGYCYQGVIEPQQHLQDRFVLRWETGEDGEVQSLLKFHRGCNSTLRVSPGLGPSSAFLGASDGVFDRRERSAQIVL